MYLSMNHMKSKFFGCIDLELCKSLKINVYFQKSFWLVCYMASMNNTDHSWGKIVSPLRPKFDLSNIPGHARTVSFHERSCYVCKVFWHWLRWFSGIYLSSLIQVLSSHIFAATPLLKPILNYFHLEHKSTIQYDLNQKRHIDESVALDCYHFVAIAI